MSWNSWCHLSRPPGWSHAGRSKQYCDCLYPSFGILQELTKPLLTTKILFESGLFLLAQAIKSLWSEIGWAQQFARLLGKRANRTDKDKEEDLPRRSLGSRLYSLSSYASQCSGYLLQSLKDGRRELGRTLPFPFGLWCLKFITRLVRIQDLSTLSNKYESNCPWRCTFRGWITCFHLGMQAHWRRFSICRGSRWVKNQRLKAPQSLQVSEQDQNWTGNSYLS